ncbi:MAG: hypothetical protein IJM35_08470 [Bacteroidales bacterium]|nr:hypothetical protein [Bacteroidales bacterium]
MRSRLWFVVWLLLVTLSTLVYGQERDSIPPVSTPGDTLAPLKVEAVKTGATFQEKEQAKRYDEGAEVLSSKQDLVPGRGNRSITVNRSLYDVGKIPLEEGVTPSGARTYSLPIAVCEADPFVPHIALTYNSQAGTGQAGYGWSITGLPCITLTSRSRWYHNTVAPASVSDTSAVYTLDGNMLVPFSDSRFPGYTLQTASGHILVRRHTRSNGTTQYFDALYPDGTKATFGWPSDNILRASFPATQMSDRLGNSITVDYYHSDDNAAVYPNYIFYGANSSISFSYSNVSNPITRYHGGAKIVYDKILTYIESSDDLSTYGRYGFTYTEDDGDRLLTGISMQRGDNGSLPPLEFAYGTDLDTIEPKVLQQDEDNHVILSQYFSNTSLVCRRGKLYRGDYTDGLMLYPSFSNYIVNRRNDGTITSIISGYESSQVILINPAINRYTGTMSITAGYGFQTAELVDIDGNGTDEVVRVRFEHDMNDKTGKTTSLFIDEYGFNPGNGGSLENMLSVRVRAKGYVYVSASGFAGPAQRAYFFGDFLGNGTTQLLAVVFGQNSYGINQTGGATLIDLVSGEIVGEDEDFNISISDSYMAMDLDRDSRTELCRITSSGVVTYNADASGTLCQGKTYTGLEPQDGYRRIISDVNTDGYPDVVYSPPCTYSSWIEIGEDEHGEPIIEEVVHDGGNRWDIFYFTGGSFVKDTVRIADIRHEDEVMFIDLDRDGIQDFIRKRADTLSWMVANGGHFSDTLKAITAEGRLTFIPCNTMDFDGMSMFITVRNADVYGYTFGTAVPRKHLLTEYTDSHGVTWGSSYGDMMKGEGYSYPAYGYVPPGAGYVCSSAPFYLLTNETAWTVVQSPYLRDTDYSWQYAVFSTEGLGFCGFRKTRVWDRLRGTKAVSTFNPERRGVPISTVTTLHDTTAVSSVTYTYDSHTEPTGGIAPRLTRSVSVDSLSLAVTDVSTYYDSYDYPTEVSTNRYFGSPVLYEGVNDEVSYLYSRSFSPSLYVLDAVGEKSAESYCNFSFLTNREEYYLDALKRPVRIETYTGEPDDDDYLRSTVSYTYDPYCGKVISTSQYPFDATSGTTTSCTYDSDGRHVTSSTDELGLTTTYARDDYGNPVSVTDAHGNVTHNTFDDWGRCIRTLRPDGSADTTSFAWGGIGLYKVATNSNTAPSTVTHYDALGREVRREEKRFDGEWLKTDTEYDNLGRVSRVSLPYRDSTQKQWSTYSYDAFDRPLSIVEPSGKTTTWSYSGASVTTVKDGITSTVTKDEAGRTASVTDAGGEISFFYRPDGQIEETRVKYTGESTYKSTWLEYDEYGRKTDMHDPGAGHWEYSYQDNSDGSSSVSATGPNGTVTTNRDVYGRTTSVVRGNSFTTSYTYDQYGRLTSESSTNGTGVAYTYDTLDRVLTSTETLPDNITFGKSYSYNAFGQLSSVQYSTGGNTITTENYLYSNGVNYKIQLPGGTPILQTLSEDGRGNVSSALTGSVTRTYSYDPAGYPSSRTMGDWMNLGTYFERSTGNMVYREDDWILEDFAYDNLNRLEENNFNPIYYDSKGNISSMDNVGSMTYGSQTNPYLLTSFTPTGGSAIAYPRQTVTYSSFDRPLTITDGTTTASIVYGGDDERVKMTVTNGSGTLLTRYYAGGRYEKDLLPNNTTVERLYLGGDAYSAPMVRIRRNGGNWVLYNIGRDYLGSIVQIADTSGNDLAYCSYDPWGNEYVYTDSPVDFLGRGFTGHEHLPWFGLINMNARLYDPLTGRFLAPDPYIQDPGFTQNYNRYTYGLNNPLKYTDESGESIVAAVIIGAVIGTYIGGVIANKGQYNPFKWNYRSGRTWGYMFAGGLVGAASGYLGGVIAASDIPFANTLSIMASSFTNSFGTHIYTGGQTPVTMSFGVASYDFTNNEWGYLGKIGNTKKQNWGYGLGLFANISDLLIGLHPEKVDLVTEHSDAVGHSSMVKHGTSTGNNKGVDPNALISVGPDRLNNPDGNWNWMKGTNSWDSHSREGEIIWRQVINANLRRINQYSKWLNKMDSSGSLLYSVELSSCVTHTSLALNLSGIFNIGIHPYLLNAQMALWSNGIRPWSFSFLF